jgi:hypothetical protein
MVNIIVTIIAVDKMIRPMIIGLVTIRSIEDIIVKIVINVRDSMFIIVGIAPIL